MVNGKKLKDLVLAKLLLINTKLFPLECTCETCPTEPLSFDENI